ncbi:alpha-ketoglutarate-dependent dioxygenase alkB homolog 7, mitochondrial-like [Acanthaster planci]|uniref:Alpha-ketoglutarate-dependent dioxygenase alkB homolog 7, mitochondrial-like n=1 Tax=Acanthaster planci TaxID=133434 RepID=A0A8B7YG79_ACAPL|nr:alpha-ketoglutarate-dependent dioxygenase alkB homolog 7, mitochondrial-like [Acanthaster planci]
MKNLQGLLRNVSLSFRKGSLPSALFVMSARLKYSAVFRGRVGWWMHALFRRSSSFSSLGLSRNPTFFFESVSVTGSLNRRCRFTDNASVLKPGNLSDYVCESSDNETADVIYQSFKLYENFVSRAEENCLLEEINDYLEDLDYEYDHWDNQIHGYRETEKSRWSTKSQLILQRIRETAFPSGEQQLPLVHVLDLAKDGYIKPHVDSVKFCGSTITGLSLLSAAIMKLAKEDNPENWVNVILKPRSLYVIKDKARYQFTHEILKDSESLFRGERVARRRRISIVCRNEPC